MSKIQQVREARDEWRRACLMLYQDCQQGTVKGRPMDLIRKRDWQEVVGLIAHAQQLDDESEAGNG